MSRLTSLTVWDCKNLRCLPDWLMDMPALKRLRVGAVDLNALPPTASRLANLTSLVLMNVTVSQSCMNLPEWDRHLPALRHLSVECSSIEAIPEGLGSLSNLESLSIRAERLSALPASLGQLSKLTALALEGCGQLKHLPDSFTKLVGLQRVWLLGCPKLVRVPLVDGQLPGSCELVVKLCPRLKLPVTNVQTDGMNEGGEEVDSLEGGSSEGMSECRGGKEGEEVWVCVHVRFCVLQWVLVASILLNQ